MRVLPKPDGCPAGQDCLGIYALEHAREAVLLADAQGRLVYANEAAGRLLRQSRDELGELTLGDLFQDALPFAREANLIETTCRRADGGQAAVEIALSHADGFVCLFVREIAQRKQMEEQLREAQKMEAVGRLVDGVAHDFNNLLTAILIYAGLLVNQLPGESPLRRHAEQVNAAAERGRALISQLLGLGRKRCLQPGPLCLNQLVESLREMLSRLVGEEIVLDINCEEPLGLMEADRTQIEQVLVNLAVNARDAMPEGGVLHIGTGNFNASEDFVRAFPDMAPGKYVTLTVTDSGCGMDAETRAHAFEPFFTTKESGRGTGLGLSTVYSVVRQSGGQVRLESAPGEGTSVRVFFPRIAEESEPRAPSGRPHGLKARTGTVLVVEDDELVRVSLRAILEGHGYCVLQAQHAAQAMWIGKEYEGPIDVMLTDLVLPGMSGAELAERMKPARPRMRALYMSGYRDDARVRRLEEEGKSFLPKPFTAEQVAEKLAELLQAAAKR